MAGLARPAHYFDRPQRPRRWTDEVDQQADVGRTGHLAGVFTVMTMRPFSLVISISGVTLVMSSTVTFLKRRCDLVQEPGRGWRRTTAASARLMTPMYSLTTGSA